MPSTPNLKFEVELAERLNQIRERGLYRQLRTIDSAQGPEIEMEGKRLVNFSSNDYLGFNQHPALQEAAAKALREYGSGCGSSRLISGSMRPHLMLEEVLADFKGTQRSIVFPSGYMSALGAITALVGPDDVIVLDRLVHASLVDAAKLSRARIRVYKHNHLEDLEKILKWTRGAGPGPKRRLIPFHRE